jgi:hypothetical protein
MRHKRQTHQPTIPKRISQKRTQQNDDPKTRQPTAGDLTKLGHRKTKLLSPLTEYPSPDRKTDPGCKNGHKTCP